VLEFCCQISSLKTPVLTLLIRINITWNVKNKDALLVMCVCFTTNVWITYSCDSYSWTLCRIYIQLLLYFEIYINCRTLRNRYIYLIRYYIRSACEYLLIDWYGMGSRPYGPDAPRPYRQVPLCPIISIRV
jgi:hypothetical protein